LFAGEVIDLEKIVVTPYRSEATIFDVNRGIAVITREEIEASGVNYLPQPSLKTKVVSWLQNS